ncbi:MAG TPA: hypothetical protein VGO69_02595, partial [Pyrinomonadaceae bacterium]|nr:hypothetical protein [Pyrinomonadaceae bacterium]
MMDARRNKNLLRALPSVDAMLRTPEARLLREKVGAQRLAELAREVTGELRAKLQGLAKDYESTNSDHTREALLIEAMRSLERACEREALFGLRRVINATGVILHTNLGRAPLAEAARLAVSDEAARYCTLEYDVEAGGRGRRGAQVERLLSELTGAENALVVDNCAAAALLV